jgi:hypothetical protein
MKSTSFVNFASIDNDHKITISKIYAEEIIRNFWKFYEKLNQVIPLDVSFRVKLAVIT